MALVTKKKPRVKAGTSKSAAATRRKAFAHAYIANGRNRTEAAITAGYNPNTAYSAGSRLLKDGETKDLIDQLTAKAEQKAELTTENVLREVRRLALSDPRKLYREDGTLKRPDEWDDDTAAFVGSVEVLEEFTGKGDDRELSGYTKKLKIWDKNAALDKAMKHLGLYEKDNSQRGESLEIKIELV